MAEITKLILARVGEIALKGLNRRKFVDKVLSNLSWRINHIGNYSVYSHESRIWIEAQDEEAHRQENIDKALAVACSVFGIVSASVVSSIHGGDFSTLEEEAKRLVQEEFQSRKKAQLRFKVESKRGDKSYPLTSPQLSKALGSSILKNFENLSVDVHEPDFICYVEVRSDMYVYTKIHSGIKGLPVGTGGKAMLLLSGGIDSPVAGYLMASRGMELEAVYYHSFPFTSDEAKEKVIQLAKILSQYTGRIKLHIVNFTEIQVNLRQNSPPEMMTITMRRIMMRIAEKIAEESQAGALITGESLGQVASQTLEGLRSTDAVVNMPVFRPLIGTDKDDTVELARKIGSYETSILPYEDCCTVFVAKHPKTRPSLEDSIKAESKLDVEQLVEDGCSNREILLISEK